MNQSVAKTQKLIDYPLFNRTIQVLATVHYGSGLCFPGVKTRERIAISVIEQWNMLAKGKICHYLSGGKDSLVVGHLICQVKPDCPMVWVNQGPLAEWADCLLLIEVLKKQGWNIQEICPARSLYQLYKEYGVPLEGRMTTRLDTIINQALMYDPIAEYETNYGIQGYAWGLRQESRVRKMFVYKHGPLYQRTDNRWLCTPIGFWRTTEIWQYIDAHKLPYPAMYDLDRMRVRNGPPIGTTGANWGRLTMLRRHHPELWAEFCREFPQIRDWS